MIGVVIPAHNEQALLAQCIHAVEQAARHPHLDGEQVRILVVLDACDDDSEALVAAAGIVGLQVDARNVGYARAVGSDYLIAQGARWIACTDADSEVAPDWLVAQLSLGAQMVCGTVQVRDWGELHEGVRQRYAQAYTQADGHRHIHGANLGFCSATYLRSGGFLPVSAHEDVQLVRAFERLGARICWSQLPRVTTSARLLGRASGGFADYLRQLALEQQTSTAPLADQSSQACGNNLNGA
ncbi:glycosyltransferase [Pseudomonas piscis]|uniref:glycosyltransferase n=1 Tax=Pseudomonas piscis TaxID=2614538 RepID=UPI0021D60A72|nr:glycosyltransferase family 2 protein [Pseudomonas piscis]MCU7646436.1 glycosyltransferase [Pseudomonas piscis]